MKQEKQYMCCLSPSDYNCYKCKRPYCSGHGDFRLTPDGHDHPFCDSCIEQMDVQWITNEMNKRVNKTC